MYPQFVLKFSMEKVLLRSKSRARSRCEETLPGLACDAPQLFNTLQVGDLKKEVETTLGIPPEYQKLMYKGMLKSESDTLEKVNTGMNTGRCARRPLIGSMQVGLKNGAKILLIATKCVVPACARSWLLAPHGQTRAGQARLQPRKACRPPPQT
jgi:hypothetical protein